MTQELSNLRTQVYNHMLTTRGQKYTWFLRGLRSFKYLTPDPARGEFLENYYVAMRFIDDVVDGDAPLPKEYSSRAEYIDRKIDFVCSDSKPLDGIEQMLKRCFALGRAFGAEFHEETVDIISSLSFDARRAGSGKLFPQAELNHYFDVLDIRGTVKATLKVFGEDPQYHQQIAPLGYATRIRYNLKDLSQDLKAGLVNISLEDAHKFGVLAPVTDASALQIWKDSELRRGKELLKEYQMQKAAMNLKPLTRATLWLMYERPCQSFFSTTNASS